MGEIDADIDHCTADVMPISIIIPSYRREHVLVNTLSCIMSLMPAPAQIIVVDQTKEHEPGTIERLAQWERNGKIRWIPIDRPSIPHAMNIGLLDATQDIVLFLDDDIIPDPGLIQAHLDAHNAKDAAVVAGRVIQPWDVGMPDPADGKFRFSSSTEQFITDFMGGNFSVKRSIALKIGGFDENFVRVAYRFESEFADRILASGEKIFFEPAACIRHLKTQAGGTRSFGEHLKTIKPSHPVGDYYYLLRSKRAGRRSWKILSRPFRAIWTQHHLRHPWWIPATLVSELTGMIWAFFLVLRGPRYIKLEHK